MIVNSYIFEKTFLSHFLPIAYKISVVRDCSHDVSQEKRKIFVAVHRLVINLPRFIIAALICNNNENRQIRQITF